MQTPNTHTLHPAPPIALNTLFSMERGDEGIITSIPDVGLLASLGVRIGKTVKMVAKSLAKGPCILHINDRSIVIDREIAKQIIIRK